MNKETIQGITMSLTTVLPILTICAAFVISLFYWNETVFTFIGGAVVGFATSQASRYSRWVGGASVDEDTTKTQPKV